MATLDLTTENFDEQVAKEGVLVIDWWAPWCGPCKVFAPIFEQSSERNPDVTFGKINTDEQPELAGTFEITAVPTLMVFRDQVLVFEQPGVVRGDALEELLTKVKALDMDEVRKEIEAHEKEHHAGGDGEDGHACGGHDHDHDHGHAHDHDHDHDAPIGDPSRRS